MSANRNCKVSRVAINVMLCLAFLVTLLPSSATAQEPWRAEYFDNRNLTGTPVVVRDESAIDHEWRNNAPAEGVPHDHFSARWTGYIYFEGGNYLFKAYTDDGVRVWVDGQLIIDHWYDQIATLHEQTLDVSNGWHSIRMDYYENIGDATAMLWWVRLYGDVTSQLWRAEYFNNPWLIGAPVVVRDEFEINYQWGSGAPVAGVAADNFSVRWTGSIHFGRNEFYTFYVTSDDGVRMWVDGALLIDQWRDQSATTFSAGRYLTQGTHPIIVEYYDRGGSATIKVWWQPGTAPPQPPTAVPPQPPVPPCEVIVDNLDAGFQKGGPSSSWYYRSVGYLGHTYWTYNSDAQVYNFAKWIPQLPQAGNYAVYAFIPRQRADTKSARYRIHHGGQEGSRYIDQSVYFDKWVPLGTYYFSADGSEYVYLDDVTGEPYASRKIGFDAVKFVCEAPPVPTATPTPWVVTPAPPTATPTPWVVTATPAPVTATPWVITATPSEPTPTSTVPGEEPTATPVPPECTITPILGFGRVWNTYATVRTRLGCPAELETNTWSAEQTFIGGYMFWRSDLRLIYALYNDGTWESFVDNWNEGDLEWDPTIVAPAGYYQPKRGFGLVWREQAGVRSKLSWGTIEERGLNASWQTYDGGMMLWSGALGIFVLYDDGTWSRYL